MGDQPSSSVWRLEHQGTHDILKLSIGDNSIGRHSESTFRYRFSFMSRHHAVFNVKSDDEISVRCMKTINGVYVNGDRLNGTVRQLAQNDVISVGLNDPAEENGIRKTVFRLRKIKRSEEIGEIVMISDEESVDEDRQKVYSPPTADPPPNPVIEVKDEIIDGIKSNETPECIADKINLSPKPSSNVKAFNDCQQKTNSNIATTSNIENSSNFEKSSFTSKVPLNDDSPSTSKNAKSSVEISNVLTSKKADTSKPITTQDSCELRFPRKSPELHMPLIPQVKQERVQMETRQILDVFGEADDFILEKAKDISGYHYNALNRRPKNIESLKNALANGEFIDVTNDQESLNVKQPKENDELSKSSPIIVINSDDEDENFLQSQVLPNDIKDELADIDENDLIEKRSNVISGIVLEPTKQGKTNFTSVASTGSINEKQLKENDNLKSNEIKKSSLDEISESPPIIVMNSDDEEENFLQSQVLINDIKEELADINENDFIENQDNMFSDVVLDPKKQEQPTFSPAVSREGSTCESDEELDSKVHNWSMKLFSQAYEPSREVSNQAFDSNVPDDVLDMIDDIFDNLPDADSIRDDVLINATDGSDSNINQIDNKNNDSPVISIHKKKVTRLESTSSNDSNAGTDKSPLSIHNLSSKKIRYLSTSSSEGDSSDTISSNKQDLTPVPLERNELTTEETTIVTEPLIDAKICESLKNSREASSDKQEEIITKGIQKTTNTEKRIQVSTVQEPTDNQHKANDDIQVAKDLQNIKRIQRRYSICASPSKDFNKLSTDGAVSEKNTYTSSREDEASRSITNKSENDNSTNSHQKANDGVQVANNLQNLKQTQRRYSICASPSKDFNKLSADGAVAKKNNYTSSPSSKTTTEKSTGVRGLQIIDAPQLPKHRGKLRGVSAVPNILNRIREETRLDGTVRDLKRKWYTKAHTKKKEAKELKEERKDRLKKLAEAEHQEPTLERETKDAKKRKFNSGQVGAKITDVNRGAFLAQEIESSPSKKPFKIPKLSERPKPTPVVAQKDTKAIATKSNTVPQRRLERTMSVDTFSQQLSAPDKLAYQQSNSHQTKLPVERKEAAVARSMRTTNKMTFAGMESFLNTKFQQEKRLDELCSKVANPSGYQIVEVNKENTPTMKPKNAKKVRFVDEPIIHYIEPIRGAFRKVGRGVKDFAGMTTSTYKSRRYAVRSNYKFVDYTNTIITDILRWSNQWLEVGSANEVAANELIMPMANEFSTYDHYRSVLFPLMKLEFQSNVERDFKLQTKTFKAELESVTRIHDRYLLITKAQKVDACRYDLQTITFGKNSETTFAYLQCLRNGSGTSCKLIFEILVNYPQEYLLANKRLTVRPVVDNVRIEFGAFNSVYQLKNTPLFNYIIHPNKLCLPNQMLFDRKLPDYKGEAARLNDEQKKTLLKTYLKVIDETKLNITLIKGPPGTGKSVLIVNLGLQCLYGSEVRWLDRKILVCSQSNTAIDNISVRFKNIADVMKNQRAKFRVVRFGMQEKMSSKAKTISLQHFVEQARKNKVQANLSVENQANLKQQEIQVEADILALKKRNYQGTSLEQQLEAKHKQLQQIRHLLNKTLSVDDEREISKCILENANIVCTTLSSCVKLAQYIDYFDICIIDEATQCTEPWTLLPLKFSMPSLVLVGDTQQLPATVMSRKANDYGLSTSMFARIQNCLEQKHPKATEDIIYKLTIQYRMHPEICKWPNQYFYRKELKNAESTLTHTTPILPYCLINLKYTTCEQGSNGKITNKLEAEFVSKLISSLKKYIPFESNTYGVISPYALHCETLKAVLKNHDRSFVTVCTVDSYQGLQRDVIIISNARTHGVGFLANYQRLNVALTRPRKNLILCGNFQNLEKVNLWSHLLRDARERNLYFEVEKDCVDNFELSLIRKLLVKKTQ